MVWTRFKRSSEVPTMILLDPIIMFQQLITIGEILFENKKIPDYSILQGIVLIHNHADVTLTVDSALKQVRVGTDIIYQCPLARNFIFGLFQNVTFPAAINLDLFKEIDPAGNILFDIDSLTQPNTNLFRGSAGMTTTAPITSRFAILEY